jgi:hypothetical protein
MEGQRRVTSVVEERQVEPAKAFGSATTSNSTIFPLVIVKPSTNKSRPRLR